MWWCVGVTAVRVTTYSGRGGDRAVARDRSHDLPIIGGFVAGVRNWLMGSHRRRRNDALLWWMMRDANQTAEQEYEHIQLLISSEFKRVLCGEAAYVRSTAVPFVSFAAGILMAGQLPKRSPSTYRSSVVG
jgi:hypothetical protein